MLSKDNFQVEKKKITPIFTAFVQMNITIIIIKSNKLGFNTIDFINYYIQKEIIKK